MSYSQNAVVGKVASPARRTPLPWIYRPNKFDDWGVVKDADGGFVAKAGGYLSITESDAHRQNKTDPHEANGNLIAAAPELLAALKAVVGEMRREHDTGDGHFSTAQVEGAEAAIAKAEGRS